MVITQQKVSGAVQNSDQLIRGLVEKLNRQGVLDDLNAEIEVVAFRGKDNSPTTLFKGRPSGLVFDRLEPRTLEFLSRVLAAPFSEASDTTPNPYIAIRANDEPALAVSATGAVRKAAPDRLAELRQDASAGESAVGSKASSLADEIIRAFERKKAGPERNFLLRLVKEIQAVPGKIADHKADKQAARTASALLDEHGSLEAGKFTYQAEGYLLERQADRVTVRDDTGKAILQFTEGYLGPNILTSSITQDQRYDFKAAQDLALNGRKNLDPEHSGGDLQPGVDTLGKLAPAGDLLVTQELAKLRAQQSSLRNASWVVDAARRWNQDYGDATGASRVYDGALYRIEQQGDQDLKVRAKDGRVLVDIQGGQLLKAELTNRDLKNFAAVQDYLIANPRDLGQGLKLAPSSISDQITRPAQVEQGQSPAESKAANSRSTVSRETASRTDGHTPESQIPNTQRGTAAQEIEPEPPVSQPRLGVPAIPEAAPSQSLVSEANNPAQAVASPAFVQPTVKSVTSLGTPTAAPPMNNDLAEKSPTELSQDEQLAKAQIAFNSATAILQVAGEEPPSGTRNSFIHEDFAIRRDYEVNTLSIREVGKDGSEGEAIFTVDTRAGQVLKQSLSDQQLSALQVVERQLQSSEQLTTSKGAER